MNVKTTLLLVAILIGVGAYFLIVELNRQAPTDDGPHGSGTPVFYVRDLDPNGVQSVTIEWQNGDSATLERDADGIWTQTQPVRFPLQNKNAQLNLARVPAALRYSEKFTPGEADKPTIADLALSPPLATVTIEGRHRLADTVGAEPADADAVPFKHVLRLGRQLGGRGYVQVDDATDVYVVNDGFHQIVLNHRAASWRSKKLPVPDEPIVDHLSITVEQQKLDMFKRDDQWQFAPPRGGRVSSQRIIELLTNLRRAPIGQFVDDNPKDMSDYGLDKPQTIVTLHASVLTLPDRTFRIGREADSKRLMYYATWTEQDKPSQVVFTIPKELRAVFNRDTEELRDPRITTLNPRDIRKVAVTLAGKPSMKLLRSAAEGWSFEKPALDQPAPPFEPDQLQMSRLIGALAAATAEQYAPSTPRPTQPAAVVTLGATGADADEELSVFDAPADAKPKDDANRWLLVYRNNEKTGYVMPATKLDLLFEPVSAFRNRQVLSLKPALINRLTIQQPGGVTYTFEQTHASDADSNAKALWRLIGHERFEVVSLGRLLQQLLRLRVERWLEDKPSLDGKRFVVTIHMHGADNKPAPAPIVLAVDAGSHDATISTEQSPFRISDKLIEAMNAEFRDHTVLALGRADLVQVRITKGGKSMTVGRDDLNRFYLAGPDGQRLEKIKVNPRVAAALFDALSPLRVERYVDAPTVKSQDAQIAIELKTRDLVTHRLYIGFKDQPRLATVNDRWFTLAEQTYKKLTADSAQANDKNKNP